MPYVSYADVTEIPDLAPGTPLGDMMRAAATVADTVNKAFPSWANPVPNFLFPAQRGIESLSQVTIPLPTPALPPPGGQCCGTFYEVTYQYTLNGVITTNTVAVQGKVGNGRIRSSPDGLLGTDIPYYACDGVERTIAGWANVSRQAFADGLYTTARVTSITPLFGGSNDCGDGLPYYEPTLPTLPDINFTFPIIIAPSIEIPINFVYIKPEIDVNIDVDANVNIPVTVNLPDVGINFNFDLGGINIQIGGGGGGFTPTKPDTPTPTPKPKPQPSVDESDIRFIVNQLRRIKEVVDDIKDCACEDDATVTFQDFAPENSGVFNLPGEPIGCQLTLTAVASNNKNQDGGTAPDVVYAGWAWYRTSQGGLSERTPIDAQQKYFPWVEGTTQFAFTCYAGNQAQLRAFYKVPIET